MRPRYETAGNRAAEERIAKRLGVILGLDFLKSMPSEEHDYIAYTKARLPVFVVEVKARKASWSQIVLWGSFKISANKVLGVPEKWGMPLLLAIEFAGEIKVAVIEAGKRIETERAWGRTDRGDPMDVGLTAVIPAHWFDDPQNLRMVA